MQCRLAALGWQSCLSVREPLPGWQAQLPRRWGEPLLQRQPRSRPGLPAQTSYGSPALPSVAPLPVSPPPAPGAVPRQRRGDASGTARTDAALHTDTAGADDSSPLIALEMGTALVAGKLHCWLPGRPPSLVCSGVFCFLSLLICGG